jgi:hypothetical protein
MRRYGDKLERRFGAVVDPEAVLGCGTWGCVLPSQDPHLAVKITSDRSEPHMAKIAQGLDLPGVVRVHEVLGGPVVKGQKIFVIVRDAIEPLGEKDYQRWKAPLGDVLREARDYAHTGRHRSRLQRAIDALPDELRLVRRAMRKFLAVGEPLTDAHAGNIARSLKTGEVILYDLGQS